LCSRKKEDTNLIMVTVSNLKQFQNSFKGKLNSKFVVKLTDPSTHAEELSEADCNARLVSIQSVTDGVSQQVKSSARKPVKA